MIEQEIDEGPEILGAMQSDVNAEKLRQFYPGRLVIMCPEDNLQVLQIVRDIFEGERLNIAVEGQGCKNGLVLLQVAWNELIELRPQVDGSER